MDKKLWAIGVKGNCLSPMVRSLQILYPLKVSLLAIVVTDYWVDHIRTELLIVHSCEHSRWICLPTYCYLALLRNVNGLCCIGWETAYGTNELWEGLDKAVHVRVIVPFKDNDEGVVAPQGIVGVVVAQISHCVVGLSFLRITPITCNRAGGIAAESILTKDHWDSYLISILVCGWRECPYQSCAFLY